jgi:hypothetical protein
MDVDDRGWRSRGAGGAEEQEEQEEQEEEKKNQKKNQQKKRKNTPSNWIEIQQNKCSNGLRGMTQLACAIGAGSQAEKTKQINDRRLERLADDTVGTIRPA